MDVIKTLFFGVGIISWIAVAWMSRQKLNIKSMITDGKFSREQISDCLEELDTSALLMDGFEDAVIGYSQRMNEPVLVVYSYVKMVDILIERDGMDYDEAVEYIDFNCLGAWVGEETPIIVMPFWGA